MPCFHSDLAGFHFIFWRVARAFSKEERAFATCVRAFSKEERAFAAGKMRGGRGEKWGAAVFWGEKAGICFAFRRGGVIFASVLYAPLDYEAKSISFIVVWIFDVCGRVGRFE